MAMTPDEKREFAIERWKSIQETNLFAQRRASELADEYTRLQVQIAVVLSAFVGLLVDKLPDGTTSHGVEMRNLFSFAILFALGSLILGLMHIKKKEWWWDDHCERRLARRKTWEAVIRNEQSFEEAVAFDAGLTKGNDIIVYSPRWTWITQTISLGIAVLAAILLVLEFLYT